MESEKPFITMCKIIKYNNIFNTVQSYPRWRGGGITTINFLLAAWRASPRWSMKWRISLTKQQRTINVVENVVFLCVGP